MVVFANLIPASIQFEYDPGELATKITIQLVHKVIVKPMCCHFRWLDRIQFEYVLHWMNLMNTLFPFGDRGEGIANRVWWIGFGV